MKEKSNEENIKGKEMNDDDDKDDSEKKKFYILDWKMLFLPKNQFSIGMILLVLMVLKIT